MSKTIHAIENSLLFGCNIKFTKNPGGYFEIRIDDLNGNTNYVVLPLSDHLNDEKVAKYINHLTNDLIK